MTRQWQVALTGGALLLGAAACGEFVSGPSSDGFSASALSAAFSSTPVGYGDLSSSFVGTSVAQFSDGAMWLGGGRGASFDRGGLMGGGLGAEFSGGVEFSRGMGGGRGPFGGGLRCAGTYNATTQRVECTETRNGLTITRSAQYKDAAGAVQQAFDTATTNSVNVREAVTGTVTYDRAADSTSGRGGPHGWGHGRGPGGRLLGDTATILTATTNVNSSSERTTTGLAAASTQRTTTGASRGTESTTGTSSRGNFTATRTVGDTTTGLVVPKATTSTTFPYPTAGTVIRSMTASVTFAGSAATTVSRREVVTYDGSATAKVVITENGVTRNCTRPLPRGPLTCS